ncbi:hypothetical protein FA15DRAFT_670159 [Coprinopsis marcescibilis]|uniref:DUF6699 domain-containing protein n=1 Tax=Coprinopsis marcescibilis TaxID=230819 RepID=A0A5C3KTL6_COPMA|nr:hypothetical protein FA15DRAFT_670159 [Coprinopsis marcescibilis]
MTAKRVQFSTSNRAYSPIPETPSPSASTSSLPSSPDIPTPPPELEDVSFQQYPRTPFAQPFDLCVIDDIEEKEMEVHCCLAYNPFAEPAISHDLSVPAVFKLAEYGSPLPLDEPATNPPLQNLTIICPEHFTELNWDIHVKAPPFPGSYISVQDTLTAIYQSLRLPVTQGEFDNLPDQVRQAVGAAYYSRYSRIGDPQERSLEAKKGVKRIDFLAGRHKFMGLSLTHNGLDCWELNVS